MMWTAVTNTRLAPLCGLPVGPSPSRPRPVPLRQSRARHEQHPFEAYCISDGFRLRLGGGAGLISLYAPFRLPLLPRLPTTDRSQAQPVGFDT